MYVMYRQLVYQASPRLIMVSSQQSFFCGNQTKSDWILGLEHATEIRPPIIMINTIKVSHIKLEYNSLIFFFSI